MTSFEVAIIGAGPAGSVAARLLASWGHEVVVCSRRTGHDRSLGESLPPSCVTLLERVGIATGGLDAAGFLRSAGNTVLWGTDERVEPFAPGVHGYQVERADFDEYLAREAVGAGADLRLGANVTGVRPGDPMAVSYEYDGEPAVLSARWVLDCSGRVGVIARSLQHPLTRVPARFPRDDKGKRTTAIVGVWERDDRWPTPEQSHTIVETTAEGWAWSVPVSLRRRYVTLMVDPTVTQLATREGLASAYLEQLSRTRLLSALVKDAQLTGPVYARDASAYDSRSFCEPGTLLVGDAASFVDPLSSYGIKKAVASAWLASVVVHSSVLNASIATAALDLFNTRERAMYDGLARGAAALARDAAGVHPTAFWESRAASIDGGIGSEPDPAVLRSDGDVLRSFEELRRSDAIRLRLSSLVQRVSRPTVRGNRIVVEEHLVVPAFPDGVRYVRNVDLVRLSELAASYGQVPDLFEAYNRAASPAPLPDFLGALSLLIGKGFLEWATADPSLRSG
ncbi:MAG: NAD(P)/FAD-dependent oxidoreductase [Gemmatimonadaceae bacterium]